MATPANAAGIKKAGAGSTQATAGNRKAPGADQGAAAFRKKASKPRTEEPPGTAKPSACTDDEKSLGEEAASAMVARAWSIIERLVVQAMKGDMKSAQMLLDLAGKEGEAREALRHGPLRSQALLWAAELPWVDDLDLKQAEI